MQHFLRRFWPPLIVLLLFASAEAAHEKYNKNRNKTNPTTGPVQPTNAANINILETGNVEENYRSINIIKKNNEGHLEDDKSESTIASNESTTTSDEYKTTINHPMKNDGDPTIQNDDPTTTDVTPSTEDDTTTTTDDDTTTTTEDTTTTTEDDTTTTTEDDTTITTEDDTTITTEDDTTTTTEDDTTTTTDDDSTTTTEDGTTTTTEDGTTTTSEDDSMTTTGYTDGPIPDPDDPPELKADVTPDDGGNPCIFATLKIVLVIPYFDFNNERRTQELAVPSYAAYGGTCAENRQELYFTWNWPQQATRASRTAERDNKVTFTWTPTGDEEFALSEMSMNILKTQVAIPELNSLENGDHFSDTVDQLTLFTAPKGRSHACAAVSQVDMDGGGGIRLSDVHLQAFNEDDEDISEASVSCSAPRHIPNGIFIAVGSVLGVIALVGIIGYIVYRNRTRRSYSLHINIQEDAFA